MLATIDVLRQRIRPGVWMPADTLIGLCASRQLVTRPRSFRRRSHEYPPPAQSARREHRPVHTSFEPSELEHAS